jgi:hypothetical protein
MRYCFCTIAIGEKYLKDDLTKIWNSYYQLTNEEELLIKQIANKL